MLIRSLPGNIPSSAPAAQPAPVASVSGQAVPGVKETQNSFDQLSLSPEPVGERRFQLELVSRISHDVRTFVTPNDDVESLRRQVQSGTYQIDAMDIASRMLLTNRGDVQ